MHHWKYQKSDFKTKNSRKLQLLVKFNGLWKNLSTFFQVPVAPTYPYVISLTRFHKGVGEKANDTKGAVLFHQHLARNFPAFLRLL